jgi:hypothetical protein
MKKKLAFLLSLFAVLNLFLAPVLALASFTPATLVNYKTNYKVAVYSQEQAKRFFSLGYELDKNLLGYTVVTNYATTLSTSITSSQTTLPVGTTKDKKGVQLATSTLGMKIYLNIEPGGTKEELVVCTGISGDTWTGCTRGLAFSGTDESAVPSYQFNHSAGSKVVMSNIHYVYQNFVDVLDPKADISYTPTIANNLTTKTWVENRNGYWEGSVANFAALPLTNNADGAARVTLDDSKLYVWASSTQAWNLAGAGGGAGTVYIDNFLGTESTGDDNKTFTLTSGSFPDKKYLQTYLNGILMEEGASADYVATSSNAVIFNDAVLDSDKITMIVVSVDLYNPAWNSVNGDILPDVSGAYDIGTTSKKFKDLNLGGSANIDGLATFGTIPVIPTTTPTSSGQVIALDDDAKLPVVDGSQLTGIWQLISSSTGTVVGVSDSSITGTATSSIPADTKYIIVNNSYSRSGSYTSYSQYTLIKGVIDSANQRLDASSEHPYFGGSISGNVLTVSGTRSGTDYVPGYFNYTIYFFK